MVVGMDSRELSPGVTAITFSGPLTLGNRLGEIDYALREMVRQGLRKLVLDLSGVDLIDSAGIGVLAVCFGSMEKNGGKVAIAGATGRVKTSLELTHLNRVAGMYPDVASAHSSFAESTP
jgi:anti-sigma B factor antagonist